MVLTVKFSHVWAPAVALWRHDMCKCKTKRAHTRTQIDHTVCLSFRDFYFPPLAHFHCMTMRFIHVPGLGPHTAGAGTSVWFCSGLQTSSCLYRSRTERSPPSSGRRHTLHTSSPNAWSGKTNKETEAVWTASTLQVSRENPDCGWNFNLST